MEELYNVAAKKLIEETELTFYPQFCLICQGNWVSKKLSEPCIYCGSRRTVNHLREILEDTEKKMGSISKRTDLDMKGKRNE